MVSSEDKILGFRVKDYMKCQSQTRFWEVHSQKQPRFPTSLYLFVNLTTTEKAKSIWLVKPKPGYESVI